MKIKKKWQGVKVHAINLAELDKGRQDIFLVKWIMLLPRCFSS